MIDIEIDVKEFKQKKDTNTLLISALSGLILFVMFGILFLFITTKSVSFNKEKNKLLDSLKTLQVLNTEIGAIKDSIVSVNNTIENIKKQKKKIRWEINKLRPISKLFSNYKFKSLILRIEKQGKGIKFISKYSKNNELVNILKRHFPLDSLFTDETGVFVSQKEVE